MKLHKNFNLTHSVFFWLFIIILFSGMLLLSKLIINHTNEVKNVHNGIEKQSYQKLQLDEDIIDLHSLDYTDIKLERQETAFDNFKSIFNFKDNLLFFSLLVYSIILSILFTYREKNNRYLLHNQELKMDQLKIDIARKEAKMNIYDEIEKGLLRYKDILSPELNMNDLDKKINTDINYILFSSRVVLEKIMLHICTFQNIQTGTLNEMIIILYKKRIFNTQINSYSHTIKAFGNRVAHPNIKNPIRYDTKDALLVLSTLVTLLQELESKNLLTRLEIVV